MAKHQYDWIKKVSRALFDCAKAPKSDVSVKPFPWDAFGEAIKKTFQLDEARFELSSVRWGAPKEFTSGVGRKPHIQPISMKPMDGMAYWIIGQREVTRLVSLLSTRDPSGVKLTDPDVLEAFYSFLATEALYCMEKLSFFQGVTPRLGQDEELPKEAGFIMDVNATLQGHSFACRIVASHDLHAQWAKQFAADGEAVAFPEELAEKIETDLHLVIGHTRLTLDEVDQVKVGDCLILEGCQLQSGGQTPVLVTCNGQALFKGQVGGGQLKLLDIPQHQEVISMIGEVK